MTEIVTSGRSQNDKSRRATYQCHKDGPIIAFPILPFHLASMKSEGNSHSSNYWKGNAQPQDGWFLAFTLDCCHVDAVDRVEMDAERSPVIERRSDSYTARKDVSLMF